MYLLQAKRIITGINHNIIEDGEMLIRGSKIVAIGKDLVVSKSDEIKIQVVDLREFTLMPGMIDCHVHLGFDGGENPVETMKESDDNALLSLMKENAKAHLRVGVTTIRDLGARSFLDIKLKKLINQDIVEGPNLIVATRPITTVKGHCWFMGCECNDENDILKAINHHVKKGTDWIKIMATGGGLTKGTERWKNQFTISEIKSAVRESRRLNKRISAHAHGSMGIENVVEAGVDTIEHCSWFSEDGIDYDSAVTQKIIEKDIYVCPTINTKWGKLPERRKKRIPQLRDMHKKGVKFIAGTDAGITQVPHDAYVDGLEVMKEIGMTNQQIIEAATITAARGLGIEQVTGSLEVGKRADIIAVKGNPLEKLSNLNNVKWVMSSGRVASVFK